jgi:hypothetical protein
VIWNGWQVFAVDTHVFRQQLIGAFNRTPSWTIGRLPECVLAFRPLLSKIRQTSMMTVDQGCGTVLLVVHQEANASILMCKRQPHWRPRLQGALILHIQLTKIMHEGGCTNRVAVR